MPTDDDFELWFRAFNTSTLGTMCLQNRLGNWVAALPRIWRVFYDKEDNCMEVLSDAEGLLRYKYGATRTFYRCQTVADGVPQGVPATATEMSEDSIRLFCQSKELYVPESEAQKSFKELLEGWGGCWMWEDLRLTEDLEWIVESLQNKSLVCVTDGSYDKQRAPDVCSAGWIMKCRRTGRQISGSLVEVSPSAGSYRGEMLGMLAI